ncbi:hypothetical protein DTO013E5_1883 [Penicillium roqueforti]|uniref:Genomic scaffold, ProqFM164S02 n=1 Tax=Penicillium roqueforti (strain FM164) TaxID=1365484 RepID=W6QCG9_PENRF|nr:uncharacterized protein LCP9604111_156 [Penicillium roqueforti]XP_057045362.1 uncharacterized protein N7518_002985 [Penicillium psychrosexuale]CDM31879.1 unnamed protein product [Penicillium roqueforti FM164]KAF9252630.1 hypothetical protein LCP9604111_156 [Penicillium roqueforti]KAI1835690.1 hypothetical protein CBS147337_3713 [Penicillium roqueforti]KAI2675459.1 hypothetical protein CBS147355_6453 [Penicillium roqueforti]KAI2687074.1 hypothetical protein LCP963914a_3675 [Penicillium roqu
MGSNNKVSSSDLPATKDPGTTSKDTTSFGQDNTSKKSASASNGKSKKGTSYMLESWEKATPSSEPWSSTKATYSPKR